MNGTRNPKPTSNDMLVSLVADVREILRIVQESRRVQDDTLREVLALRQEVRELKVFAKPEKKKNSKG